MSADAGREAVHVDIKDRVAWLQHSINHIEGQIALGDTRASLLLAADSLLLTALATTLSGQDSPVADLSPYTVGLVSTCAAALALSLALALLAVIPNRGNLWLSRGHEPNLVNFSSIAAGEACDFVADATKMTWERMLTGLAVATHGKSAWLTRKFRRLYAAVAATLLGVAAAALAGLVELVHRA